jgi:hypothetical protein
MCFCVITIQNNAMQFEVLILKVFGIQFYSDAK